MSKQNGKASWDIRATKVFINLCIEEVEKGGRKGTSLTKPAWSSLEDNFTAKTGRAYTKIQLKNKFDSLRKEWQLWDRLLRETGLGWDAEKNTVSAPDDWWERKIVEVLGYEKFRERGLQFRAELTQLFGSVAATGPQSWAPSSMTLPSEGVPENDMEEGSGDSDEILMAPTGISGEFNSVTFNDNSGGSGGNTGMRRENSRGGRSTSGSRPSSSLGREYEEISEARARKIEEEARAYETSIAGVMEHLNEVEEVVDDPDLFGRCTTLLMREQAAREMYVTLKNKRERLLIFLKHATKY
ncbi:L10-interacting MYB domain-containing protein-like [Neltuma alba]|uniref:L10-interacting MYB domain-containing protein-like n=1 Tax=Neltuma alba TaxID=207710 RepID=UPI0010A50CE6|nr:L10-interacting MYB domain-containing protein-like [Prosopis alba]